MMANTIPSYSRICIFGRPGSGKSTFALKLHRKTGIPLHHLDRYFYKENWIERDYEEFIAIQQDMINQQQWIIDGNSLLSLEIRYARSEICLYFNYPRWTCLFRLIKRFFTKDAAIKDRAQGCEESIRWRLIKYLWTFEQRKNGRILSDIARLRKQFPNVIFLEIRNKYDLKKTSELLGL